MADKITRIDDLVIDRTHDCPVPGDHYNIRRECEGCGRKKIVIVDDKSGMKLRPPVMRWYFKCFGCGRVDEGGAWHPRTAEEYHLSRWQSAQEDDNG